MVTLRPTRPPKQRHCGWVRLSAGQRAKRPQPQPEKNAGGEAGDCVQNCETLANAPARLIAMYGTTTFTGNKRWSKISGLKSEELKKLKLGSA